MMYFVLLPIIVVMILMIAFHLGDRQPNDIDANNLYEENMRYLICGGLVSGEGLTDEREECCENEDVSYDDVYY